MGCACATTLARRASAASFSVSSNSIGATLTHVPFQVIGQHAEKDMRTHPIGQPVMHRPDLEIDRLDAAEGTLHQGEGFVAAHGRRVVERLGGQAGAYDIDAVGRRLAAISVVLRAKLTAAPVMSRSKCFA